MGKVLSWHFIISICGSPHPTEDNHSDVSIQDVSPAFGCHIFKTLINAVEKCYIWWKDLVRVLVPNQKLSQKVDNLIMLPSKMPHFSQGLRRKQSQNALRQALK